MDYTNLQVLAEVSVTLLGFSGITTIVGRSRFAQQGAVFRMRGLLYSSSSAFVVSILPLVGIPLLPAAIGSAVYVLPFIVWAWKGVFGRSRREIQPNPAIKWTLFPVSILVYLYLWWSILAMADQLLFAYQLQIGTLLLSATMYFVRLVSSSFVTDDSAGSGD